ncbi:MAG: hypothetical protein AB1744_13570 [Candidatus Zixiibacteriota bacterium]
MRNAILLLIGIIALYLLSSLVLQGIYGPSYGFLEGEDRWIPDGQGGWVKHGEPDSPPPAQPSVDVPIWVRYIPIFLPALLLILFMFTPLRKYVEKQPDKESADTGDSTDE